MNIEWDNASSKTHCPVSSIYDNYTHSSIYDNYIQSQMVNTEIGFIIFFVAKDREALYSQEKQDRELTVVKIANTLFKNSDLNWSRENH